MYISRFRTITLLSTCAFLFVGLLIVSQHASIATANSGSGSSSGGSSSNDTDDDSGRFYGDYMDHVINGTISNQEEFSSGNLGVESSATDSFAESTGGTVFYSNGDGTYNTITYQSNSNDDDDSDGSYVDTGRCPSGYTRYQGACYPDSSCHTQGGGKGGGKTVCEAPGGGNGGSGSSSGPDNCSLDGVTVSHGDTYTFYTSESVPYGSSCSGQGRRCNDGNLSGSGNYNQSSCYVEDAPPISDVTITADPRFVRPSESTTISWDGGNAEECTVEGPMISATGVTGSREVSGLNGEAEYTLHCTLDTQEAEDTATVQIIPEVQET